MPIDTAFDYNKSAVPKVEVESLRSGQFTEDAHNLIFIGGTGTGKTHTAIALGTTLTNISHTGSSRQAPSPYKTQTDLYVNIYAA